MAESGFHSEEELDGFLRAALLCANTPAVMNLGEEVADFSPAFERKMHRLLADPFRRAGKALRPLWARALGNAAMFLLVVTVSVFAVMANPTARAWVEKVVTQWSEVAARFIFQGAAQGAAEGWTPEFLPEGFALTQTSGSPEHNRSYQYEDGNGGVIFFDCVAMGQGFVTSVDSEHSDPEQFTVNGRPATLLRNITAGKPSYLIWTDSDETTWFCLMSELDPDELIKIAESVTAIK